jgi:hypothetical protein
VVGCALGGVGPAVGGIGWAVAVLLILLVWFAVELITAGGQAGQALFHVCGSRGTFSTVSPGSASAPHAARGTAFSAASDPLEYHSTEEMRLVPGGGVTKQPLGDALDVVRPSYIPAAHGSTGLEGGAERPAWNRPESLLLPRGIEEATR